jgi:hypothetical protein
MKQYRIKTPKGWSIWVTINNPISNLAKNADILTIQFNEPLTVEEAKEFFKHYEVE